MTPVEKDDFTHALGQTMNFYGKELDKVQASFWITACKDRPVAKLKKALLQHVQIGKFAPKPADVLTLVDQMSEHGRAREALPPPPKTSCPPEIARAWMWFNAVITSGSRNLDGIFSMSKDMTPELEERYLHIVNHEAHKYETPEAIPDEYKLPEVWGPH